MDADLDTLATALYVRVDDLLKSSPEHAPARPKVGITPKISDAELVTLSVMQALLGHSSEARWLRFALGVVAGLVPVSAQAARLQQAATVAGGHDALADRGAGPRHQRLDR